MGLRCEGASGKMIQEEELSRRNHNSKVAFHSNSPGYKYLLTKRPQGANIDIPSAQTAPDLPQICFVIVPQ